MRPFLIIIALFTLTSVTVLSQIPVLTETMTFTPIPVGAQREMRLVIDRLPSGASYQVAQAPSMPFTIKSTSTDLTVRGDEINVIVDFSPTMEGDYRDEILLRRSPVTGQPSLDEIRVRLFATAFRIERMDQLDFANVMTGDTAKQAVLYRVNRNDDFTFDFMGTLKAPFVLLTAQGPVRRGFDTLAVVVAFSPSAAGVYADTIGLIRRDRMGRNLDTAIIEVTGIGRRMPESKVVDLRGLTAGDYANRTVDIDLPSKIYVTNFTYSVESRQAASYTSATLQSPTAPSKNTQIRVAISANPQTRVDETSRYVLLRKLSDGRVIDSTSIILDVAASSRPNTWTASLGTGLITARIGDTVALPLIVRASGPVDEPLQISELTYKVSYNPTVFVPRPDVNQQLSVVDNAQVLTTSGVFAQPPAIDSDGDTLYTLRAVVALGDADSTVLRVSDVLCTDASGKTIVMKGSSTTLRITNAWRYADGRTRLVNTLQEMLKLDIDPNPIIANAVLRVRDLPRETASLVIIDALGIVRADLSAALNSGKRDFTIATSGNADVTLGAGTYYARCLVESELGGTLNSVVRIFLVQ